MCTKKYEYIHRLTADIDENIRLHRVVYVEYLINNSLHSALT